MDMLPTTCMRILQPQTESGPRNYFFIFRFVFHVFSCFISFSDHVKLSFSCFSFSNYVKMSFSFVYRRVGGISWGYVGPSWGYVGPASGYVGPSWGYVGPSWSYVGPSWGYVGPYWGLCCPILGQCSPILRPILAHVDPS